MHEVVQRGHRRRRLATLALAIALAGAGVGAVGPDAADAQAGNPYQRGPAPTSASIEASRGPFATAQATATGYSGFGGGTIYYPTSTAEGTFGAVAISPGFTARQSSISWLGPRLASQGFVVITIDTNTTSDQPESRGDQLQAALDYLVSSRSPVASRIDRTRLAVMGHSMGGGGTLAAARDNPALQAAIPLTGWHTTKRFNTRVPTLVIGAQNDSVASVTSHSEPFYEGLPADADKAYLELAGASHFAPNTSNTTIARYSIAWLKRFVDNDTRYDQFLCPAPRAGGAISEYRSTCPYSGGGGPGPTTPTTNPPTPTTTPPADDCQWWEWWCRWLNR